MSVQVSNGRMSGITTSILTNQKAIVNPIIQDGYMAQNWAKTLRANWLIDIFF